MKIVIAKMLSGWLALGLLTQASPGQSPSTTLKAIAGTRGGGGKSARTPALVPTDEDLLKAVDETIQKIVFRGVREVSLVAYVHDRRGSGSEETLKDNFVRDIAARLKRMGIAVAENDMSKRPILALNLHLINVPDSARYVAYYLELAMCEKVTLQRDSIGTPPAKTYRFRESGVFTTANLPLDLKAAYNRLLDSLQEALVVSRAPD